MPTYRQRLAIDLARKQGGGKLVRYKLGHWSTSNARLDNEGHPLLYVVGETITSLVLSNVFVVSRRSETGFPIEVSLAEPTLI
jgi:hypothetical protein